MLHHPLVLGSKLFEHLGLLILVSLRQKIRLSVPMELPKVNTVFLCDRNDTVTIEWVESDICHRICVANKSLEVIRDRLLCIVVPNLQKIVFTASQHIASVETQIRAVDSTSMDRQYLSDESPFKLIKLHKLDLQVFSNHGHLSAVFVKFKGT